MGQYKWIWSYIKKYKWLYIFALVLCAIVAGMGMVNPYIGGRMIEKVFQNGETSLFTGFILIMVTVTFTKTIIRYIFLVIFEYISQRILLHLRRDLYQAVQKQSHSFFDKNKVGDIMARMTGDLDAIRHFVCYVVYAIFENVLYFIIAICMIFYISWQMALLLMLVGPVVFFCTVKQSFALKPMFGKVREQFSKLNSVCQENISGNRVVKAFTKEDYEVEKFTRENQEYWQCNVNTAHTWLKYLPIMDFCAGFLFFILISVGSLLVIWGKLELWQLITINGYLWAVNNPMRLMGWLVNDASRFVASLEKVFSLMRQKTVIYSPEDAYEVNRLRGKVEFKNVSFGYDINNPGDMVLRDVSFVAEAGFTVGILGTTGSGKTTLVNIISRFYDVTKGEVLVDGVDVRKYDLHSLRKDIAYATQDIFLFSDTVEGNIAYGVPDTEMDNIFKAADIADANDFVLKLEDGYDTIVGERGVGLSGGQRQRLALARAVAADPSILILDDTTSAVDMETEQEIQKALNEKFGKRTTFIIASRISSVRDADLILVFDNGKIIQNGTHRQLLKEKDGYYSQLFESQYSAMAEFAG